MIYFLYLGPCLSFVVFLSVPVAKVRSLVVMLLCICACLASISLCHYYLDVSKAHSAYVDRKGYDEERRSRLSFMWRIGSTWQKCDFMGEKSRYVCTHSYIHIWFFDLFIPFSVRYRSNPCKPFNPIVPYHVVALQYIPIG